MPNRTTFCAANLDRRDATDAEIWGGVFSAVLASLRLAGGLNWLRLSYAVSIVGLDADSS